MNHRVHSLFCGKCRHAVCIYRTVCIRQLVFWKF